MTDKKRVLTAALADKKARKIIWDRIEASTDEKLAPVYRSVAMMKSVGFFDIVDILFYYLALQPDIGEIGAGREFSDLFAKSDCSVGGIAQCWKKDGKGRFPFLRESPWANGPGPMGGTASDAESYQLTNTGFRVTIKEYFLWPESLAEESERNWPRHKQRVEDWIFPKFRRKYNAKKLAAILDFAEAVCELMRRTAAKETQKK